MIESTRFSVMLEGAHSEGPEAKTRLDKIVQEFVNKLFVNGFLLDNVASDAGSFVAPTTASTSDTTHKVVQPADERSRS